MNNKDMRELIADFSQWLDIETVIITAKKYQELTGKGFLKHFASATVLLSNTIQLYKYKECLGEKYLPSLFELLNHKKYVIHFALAQVLLGPSIELLNTKKYVTNRALAKVELPMPKKYLTHRAALAKAMLSKRVVKLETRDFYKLLKDSLEGCESALKRCKPGEHHDLMSLLSKHNEHKSSLYDKKIYESEVYLDFKRDYLVLFKDSLVRETPIGVISAN